MKKNFLILSALLINLISCYAQELDTSKSLLWKISNGEMKQPSYLFGTIHMICPDDYLWTPKMKKAFDKAVEVCFEMDMDDPMLMLSIAQGMIANDGKELKDYFSPDQYKKIEQFLIDSVNMEPEMFRQMKPAALLSVFTTKIVNCNTPLTYEFVMMEAAQKQKKEITGLEAVSEQIELFYNLPTDSIAEDILDMIEKNNDARSEYQKMVAAYKNQDIQLLYKIIQSSGDIGTPLDMFLDQRNEKWIDRMIDKMDQQSVFFAVGAGHLPGNKGVITLLRNAGYKVEAIK